MSQILTRLEDGVLRLEINRPEKKNALTADMYSAAAEALRAAEGDPAVRAILIHGQPGGTFTAGNDLADFLERPPQDETAPVFRFINSLPEIGKPLVAAVSGAAAGIGTTLLLHCDLVYADPTARFLLPFVGLGLCPEAGSSLLLAERIGPARAAEMLLLGEPLNADAALACGLVNAIVPTAELLEHALAKSRKLAAQSADALRVSKALMRRGGRAAVREAMQAEGAEFKTCLNSPDAKAAFAAFLNKGKR
jgi:enoyl-CoA hydratase/carnithine racemase